MAPHENELGEGDLMELANLTDLLGWTKEKFVSTRKLAIKLSSEEKEGLVKKKTELMNKLISELNRPRRFNDVGDVYRAARESRTEIVTNLLECVATLEVSRLLDMGEINRVLRGKEQEV